MKINILIGLVLVSFYSISCNDDQSCDITNFVNNDLINIRVQNISGNNLTNIQLQSILNFNSNIESVFFDIVDLKNNEKSNYQQIESFNSKCFALKSNEVNFSIIDCLSESLLNAGYYTITFPNINGGSVLRKDN